MDHGGSFEERLGERLRLVLATAGKNDPELAAKIATVVTGFVVEEATALRDHLEANGVALKPWPHARRSRPLGFGGA